MAVEAIRAPVPHFWNIFRDEDTLRLSKFTLEIGIPGFTREPERDIRADGRADHRNGRVLVPRVPAARNENRDKDIGTAKGGYRGTV